MSWELSPSKLAAIRWYALRTEILALSISSTRRESQHADASFEQVTAILKAALAQLDGMRASFGENIDCAIGTVPCDGLCVPDCPPRPASGGNQSQALRT